MVYRKSVSVGYVDEIEGVLSAFESLKVVEKIIFGSEILKQVRLIGCVDSINDSQSKIVPLIKPVQDYLTVSPKYLGDIYPLLEKFNALPGECKTICLSRILNSVSFALIVGAFDSGYRRMDDPILTQAGFFIFPAIPAEQAAQAISNASQAEFRVDLPAAHLCPEVSFMESDDCFSYTVIEQLYDVHHQRLSTELLSAFDSLPFRQKLFYASELLPILSLYGVMDGTESVAVADRIFPLIKADSRASRNLLDQPFFRHMESLPDDYKSSCLTAIFRSIPVSLIVGAVTDASSVQRVESRNIFPASPANEALRVLTNAYRCFGI